MYINLHQYSIRITEWISTSTWLQNVDDDNDDRPAPQQQQ